MARRKTRRKFVVTTDRNHLQPVAENFLARDLSPEQPNRVWASDLTCLPTKEGWLYLAITMDLYARRIMGWAMDATMPAELPLKALQMALERRSLLPGLLHHSDRGSQYTSGAVQKELAAHQLVCNMSGEEECWDNAVSESFFATLKRELVDGRIYETRERARGEVFEHVEVYCNRKRLHSTLSYLTPAEAEKQL
ncbi:IS3 family transposase [Deinococcus sp.]|uniref:IS3 family transposase n=1 Tax=Deinococcus sp. TaxID=47478 RepID=UPI003C7CDF9B